MSAERKIRQQLGLSTVTTLVSLVETPTDYHVECSCGYRSRRFKRISTARRYLVGHRDGHREARP